MATEAQKRAQAKYNMKTRTFIMRLRLDRDFDIIKKLLSEKNMTAYMRNLIRHDIEDED